MVTPNYPNITTAFTDANKADERKYGNKVIIKPLQRDPELTQRFAEGEAKYPSNSLAVRRANRIIEEAFNAQGQFVLVQTPTTAVQADTSKAVSIKAPRVFGVFGKSTDANKENVPQETGPTPTNTLKP